MNIAIVGAGFTGLAAAYSLVSEHNITIFEKEPRIGGLAGTYKQPDWEWPVEQHYHHWFTNDTYALSLIRELGMEQDLLVPKTITAWWVHDSIQPFNSPGDVLRFPYLSPIDRLRTGVVTAALKALPPSLAIHLEQTTAVRWIRRYYGESGYRIIWEPLLRGKFGQYADTVNMAWFWARVYKRTPRLAYLSGGYHRLMDAVAQRIEEQGGIIRLSHPFDPKDAKKFDRIIVTTPSPIFLNIFPSLPTTYRKRLTAIPHLHALNLLLITKEPVLRDAYWLSISDPTFPFLAVVQQTHLVDKKYYGGNHLTYIANYLPKDHPYLKMTKEQLFKVFLPYLKKINPSFNLSSSAKATADKQLTTHNSQLFFGPFAQPVFGVNYSKVKPDFVTPIKNVYLANMDMVYPWDRGTNYAIELGYRVAQIATHT